MADYQHFVFSMMHDSGLQQKGKKIRENFRIFSLTKNFSFLFAKFCFNQFHEIVNVKILKKIRKYTKKHENFAKNTLFLIGCLVV